MNLLITGGTGSLGHALARHFLAGGASKVAVLSRDEVKQAQMARTIPDPRMRFMLGDVRDLSRLEVAFHGYDAIVHAAALKRVDAVADTPSEVFRTNLDGTRNVLSAALSRRVPKVLVISSDKACYPTNAYGVSKAAAEAETTAWNRFSVPRGVRCSVLRYGNVLGSRGSVIHAWRAHEKQWVDEHGKGEPFHFSYSPSDVDPYPITHPDMTRFVITMPEACQAVAWALGVMEGGEVFVPELPACGILDLLEATTGARRHTITGLRPGGEKLHETLLTLEESSRTVDTREGFWAVRPHLHQWRESVPWAMYERVPVGPYVSAGARQMGVRELREKLRDVPTEGV